MQSDLKYGKITELIGINSYLATKRLEGPSGRETTSQVQVAKTFFSLE